MTPTSPVPTLLHDLVAIAAHRAPESIALTSNDQHLSYGSLHEQVSAFAGALVRAGLARGERVGIYLEKRFEFVAAAFGAAAAGGVFVPINPVLKPEQVVFIMADCEVRVLVTSAARAATLRPLLGQCSALRLLVLVDGTSDDSASVASLQ